MKVVTVTPFNDKLENKHRGKGEQFEVTPERLKEIQTYEKANNIKLIKKQPAKRKKETANVNKD